jgi:hypothetical protein
MKKASEEEKDYYRKVFEERTGVVEYAYGWGWVPIKTKEELEKLLNTDNIMNFRYDIRVVPLEPYGNITDFLDKQKSHGPYLIPINIQPKMLIYPIEIKDDGITIYTGSGGYGEVYSEFITYKSLKLNYTWQDGHPCGKF